MNSKVIKFVAGAGKTTLAEKYLKENENGLYIAFNNRVVDELKCKGYLCKTIDALFESFIIPKFTTIIPLISNGAKVKYLKSDDLKKYEKGILNIKLHEDGKLYNRSKYTGIDLNLQNEELYILKNFTNLFFIKMIFSKDSLNLNDQFRSELSNYIIKNYPNQIIEILDKRFSYIIIDEAQDLKAYREEFIKLLYNSNIKIIILGDDNQNINSGGIWFENLHPDIIKNKTYRCPENICKWIRENLKINIYGTDYDAEYIKINKTDVLKYDDENRFLLYNSSVGQNKILIDSWKGNKMTIKTAKGLTINEDIVIIGDSLSKKNLYTAITRTKKNCYSTINKIN